MNLHEHQAKALLRDYGIPMTDGVNVETPAEAALAAENLGGGSWAVKAQIHAGLRQKAGGVRMVGSPEEVRATAAELLGSRLVTPQTGPEGKTVKSVYVERAVGYAHEVYLAALVDRSAGRVALIAAQTGGDDIEDWVAEDRRKLLAFARDLLNSDYAGHRITFELFAQSPPFAHLNAVYNNFDFSGPLEFVQRSAGLSDKVMGENYQAKWSTV